MGKKWWNKVTGITKAKRQFAKATGISTSRAGRQRKLKRQTIGCAPAFVAMAIVLATLVACGSGGGPGPATPLKLDGRPESGAPKGEVTPEVSRASNRYAVARSQVSRIGPMQVDMIAVGRWTMTRSEGLLITLRTRGTPEGLAALWYAGGEPGPVLTSVTTGRSYPQFTDSTLLGPIKPTPDGCMILFKATEVTEYMLELPLVANGIRGAFRFRIPALIQKRAIGVEHVTPNEPFTRSAAPVDSEPDDVAAALTTPAMVPVAKPDPARVIAGSVKAPVAAGRTVAHVEDYEVNDQPSAGAKGIYAAGRLLADGDVCLFAEPTTCVVEGFPAKGWLTVRPTEGPHKGKLLAVREAGVGAAAK